MQRDARIDFIRGAGVLMIALDHLGGVAERLAPGNFTLLFTTWTRIGWSSAAEFFVFFSGYLIGLVYARTLQARGPLMLQARAVHRSWEIYAANVLTLCVTLVLLYATPLGGAALIQAAQLTQLTGVGAGAGWVGFLTLSSAPMFFEILQLYVVLLLVAPLFLLLARVSALGAFAVSFAIWLISQFNPQLNLAAWHFNPFAWQLVFVLGMLCSVGGVFARIDAVNRRRSILLGTGGLLLFAFIVKAIDKSGLALPVIGPITVGGIDKGTLDPVRLGHFLVSVVFVMQLVPRSAGANASWSVQSVARIGRYSLECFCASTIVVYACAGLLYHRTSITTLSVALGGAVLIVAICAFAVFMEWVRSEPWRGAGAKHPEREASLESKTVEGGSAHLSALTSQVVGESR